MASQENIAGCLEQLTVKWHSPPSYPLPRHLRILTLVWKSGLPLPLATSLGDLVSIGVHHRGQWQRPRSDSPVLRARPRVEDD